VQPPAELLVSTIDRWIADPDGDVEYAELLDGRWATRMRQTVREATTVWWDLGQRTLRVEAYVLPAPETNHDAVYRLCLVRNASMFRLRYALDGEGAVVLRARVALEHIADAVLDQILGEIYELVELSFRGLVKLAFERTR
jgi:hypothetical protein